MPWRSGGSQPRHAANLAPIFCEKIISHDPLFLSSHLAQNINGVSGIVPSPHAAGAGAETAVVRHS